ncbi:MAG: hypothetical protein ACI4M3_00500, partial [Acutalibacteraceae bacterium]
APIDCSTKEVEISGIKDVQIEIPQIGYVDTHLDFSEFERDCVPDNKSENRVKMIEDELEKMLAESNIKKLSAVSLNIVQEICSDLKKG